MKQTLIILACFIFPVIVHAHPGRTDSSGCHTCRTNCSSWGLSNGEYHCHRAKAAPQPKEPIKSTYGEGGTGSTSPAPEYKNPKVETPKEIAPKKTVDLSSEIKKEIEKSEAQYYSSPDGFRERLTRKIAEQLKTSETIVGASVYSMLPNIYNQSEAELTYKIKKEIKNVEGKYYNNPHGFREKLTVQIAQYLNVSEENIGEYVYSMLPNIYN